MWGQNRCQEKHCDDPLTVLVHRAKRKTAGQRTGLGLSKSTTGSFWSGCRAQLWRMQIPGAMPVLKDSRIVVMMMTVKILMMWGQVPKQDRGTWSAGEAAQPLWPRWLLSSSLIPCQDARELWCLNSQQIHTEPGSRNRDVACILVGLTVYREAAESSNDHANPGHHDKAEHAALGLCKEMWPGKEVAWQSAMLGTHEEKTVWPGEAAGLRCREAPNHVKGAHLTPRQAGGDSTTPLLRSQLRHQALLDATGTEEGTPRRKGGPQGGRGDSDSKCHTPDCKGLNVWTQDSVQALAGSPPTSVLSSTDPEWVLNHKTKKDISKTEKTKRQDPG